MQIGALDQRQGLGPGDKSSISVQEILSNQFKKVYEKCVLCFAAYVSLIFSTLSQSEKKETRFQQYIYLKGARTKLSISFFNCVLKRIKKKKKETKKTRNKWRKNLCIKLQELNLIYLDTELKHHFYVFKYGEK